MDIQSLHKRIEALSNIPGAPGHEDLVRRYMHEELDRMGVHSRYVDRLGNLVADVPGNDPSAPSVLLDGHLDEPAFIVRHISDAGYIYMGQVGYVTELTVSGQRVTVWTRSGGVTGVVGVKSYHMTTAEERMQGLSWENMWVDVGALDKEDCLRMGIRIGDPITFDRTMTDLANDIVTGKALDGRIACAMVLEIVEELIKTGHACRLFVAGSVQEEEVVRGATTACNSIREAFGALPDFAFVFDITLAGDFPTVQRHISPIDVGKGPTIKVFDRSRGNIERGIIVSPRVVRFLEDVAASENVPYQYEVHRVATNADVYSVQGTGVITGGISVPCRYTHTPVEVLSLRDTLNGIKLCVAAIRRLPEVFQSLLPA